MIYLLDYDRAAGSLVSIRSFDHVDRELAEKARLDLELLHLTQGSLREVVLLEAQTQADLERTHRRYFERLEELTVGPNSVFAEAK